MRFRIVVNNAVRMDGSLNRVFACSAGGPGFNFRLRPIGLGCSYAVEFADR
jgi:hypothetical protein